MSIRAFLWRAYRWIGLLCAVAFLVLAFTGLTMLVDHSLGIGSTSRLDSPVSSVDGIDRALAEVMRERPDLKLGMVLPGIDERHSSTASLRGANGTMLPADFDPGSLLPLILAATGPRLWLRRRFSTRSKAAGT